MKCCHSCMLFQVHLLDQQLYALLRNLLTNIPCTLSPSARQKRDRLHLTKA